MAVYVDGKNCTVRDGEMAWPFDIDCHDGVAHITLDNRRYALRPLGWREKRNLARFAHLGEQFLQTQFIRVSLKDSDAEVPATDDQRIVLSALARWLNAPDGNFGLPLDAQLLATVTLDICRSMHLAPTVFDPLDAMEVEMLWRAAQRKQVMPTQADAQAPATPGMTRIVVVPDRAGERLEQPSESVGDIDRKISLRDETDQAQATSAEMSAESLAVSDRASESLPEAKGYGNNVTANFNAPATLTTEADTKVAGLASRITTAAHNENHNPRASHLRNRFRVDLAAPVWDTENRDDSDPVKPYNVQADAADPASLQISVSTATAAANASDHSDAILAGRIERSATAAIYPELIDGGTITIPAAEAATLAAEFGAMTTLQFADQLFVMFAERLDEAAYAAGIDLEN